MSDAILLGRFVSNKVGKTGLTVTVTVKRIEVASGTVTTPVSGASAFEIGNGAYGYRLTGADFYSYDYLYTFSTTDTTVDEKESQGIAPDSTLRFLLDSSGKVSLAASQSFNNTGQSTELPSADATVRGKLPGDTIASQASVAAIRNNRDVAIVIADQVQRPESGSKTFAIEVRTYKADAGGYVTPEDADSSPTIAAYVSIGGDSRNDHLGSTTLTHVSTGYYAGTYTVQSTDALEQIKLDVSIVRSGNTSVFTESFVVVDTIAADYTTDDRARDNALAALVTGPVALEETLVDARDDILTAVDGVPGEIDLSGLATSEDTDAILTSVNALGATSRPLNRVNGVSEDGKVLTLVQGDDYYVKYARAMQWEPIAGPTIETLRDVDSVWWLVIDDAETFKAQLTATWSDAGVAFTWEPTSDETRGIPNSVERYYIVNVAPGNGPDDTSEMRLVSGTVQVVDDIGVLPGSDGE